MNGSLRLTCVTWSGAFNAQELTAGTSHMPGNVPPFSRFVPVFWFDANAVWRKGKSRLRKVSKANELPNGSACPAVTWGCTDCRLVNNHKITAVIPFAGNSRIRSCVSEKWALAGVDVREFLGT